MEKNVKKQSQEKKTVEGTVLSTKKPETLRNTRWKQKVKENREEKKNSYNSLLPFY